MDSRRRLWILSGSFGGLLFTINFFLGASLSYLTGNPGFSGLVTGFTTAFVFYVLLRLTRTFGAMSIAFTLYCLLAIPTVLMGPPGPYKVIVGLSSGLAFDIVLWILRYRLWSFLVGFVVYVLTMLAGMYVCYMYFDFPGLETLRGVMFILAVIFAVEGCLGGSIAHMLFERRLRRLTVVKRVSMVPLEE